MPTSYQQLLEAIIRHLEELKAEGTSFVSVSPEIRSALTAPAAPSRVGPAVPGPSLASTRPARPAFEPTIAPPHLAGSASGPKPPPAQESFDTVLSPSPPEASLGREAKEAALAELRARALVCQKCPHLAASRKNVVFGVGDIHSPLLFVGEAPGADEDEQGEPFVGKAGRLLTKIIQTMGFRRESVYIANILKCRPDTPGHSMGNRKPTAEEMKTCLPYLLAQIDLMQPRVIVALGATAVEGLLGISGGITKLRGRWQEFRGVPVMPTYHPAYLLRNEALSEKRKVWEDMLQVLERLDRPLTDKQRSYFLKA